MTSDQVPQPQKVAGLSFPLQEGETVIRLVRRHWLYLWPSIFLQALFALLPPIVVGLLLAEAGAYDGAVARVFQVIVFVYLVVWAGRIFLAWYRYQHDLWVITNQRIVDSIKRNPFSLRVSTADLVNVQDMTVEREGPLRTIFDYGDVICQTAADQQEFRIAGVPAPRDIQALVDRERDRERMRVRGV